MKEKKQNYPSTLVDAIFDQSLYLKCDRNGAIVYANKLMLDVANLNIEAIKK